MPGRHFETSLTAFREHFPDIAERIASVETPFTEILADGEVVDVEVGGRRFYGENGLTAAHSQVDAFVEKPKRFFIDDPRKAGMGSPVGLRMIERMYKEVRPFGEKALDIYPQEGLFHLCVFGVGLGHHLQQLYDRLKPKWIFLVEPMPQMLHHSLGAFDWQAFLAKAKEDDVEVMIILDDNVDRLTRVMGRMIKVRGTGFFDGSYIFQHHPLWTLSEARRRLVDDMRRRFIAAGFYEDELVMMTNATSNFRNVRGHVIDGAPMRLRPEPVFIIGSGPSVDEAMPVIKRDRDRAVVISCGTSLRILLKNGIIPNFHVEIENTPETVDALTTSGQYGDLKKVTLIASATVDPRVPGMFGEAIFFFRDSVSSTFLLGRRFKDVFGGSPTVANTALAMASLFGFTRYFFFGVDCGVLPGGEHHSKDTMYYDGDTWKEYIDEVLKYPTKVPANFGGHAFTEVTLNASRNLLGTVISLRGLEAYNCSDGCLIENTIPMLPECVEITSPPVDWAAVMKASKEQMHAFEPGEMLKDADPEAIVTGLHDYCDSLLEMLDRVEGEGGGVPEVYREVVAHELTLIGRFSNAWAIPLGSVRTLPRIGMFFTGRVRLEDQRRHLTAAFFEEYRSLLQEMRDGAEAMVRTQFGIERQAAAA